MKNKENEMRGSYKMRILRKCGVNEMWVIEGFAIMEMSGTEVSGHENYMAIELSGH